ncbi:MAG: pentapeptide repeat-containing protein [Deltaproteobacteria bacterium]|nr:pentapeptide repeat-containing protein [Deltaproteobacteria bacterium]
MKRSALVLASLLTLTAVASGPLGCAAPPGADPGEGEGAGAAEHTATTSSASSAAWCWWDCATWPPRPKEAMGAHHDDVCSRDDGDTAARFTKFITQRGDPAPGPVSSDVSTWHMTRWGWYECDECNLDGATLKVPPGTERITLSMSSARGTTFPGGVAYELFDTYARDAKFVGGDVELSVHDSDVRCASYEGKVTLRWDSNDSTLAGASKLNLDVPEDVFTIDLTGAHGSSISVGGGARLEDLRIDGMDASSVVRVAGELGGTVHLEGFDGSLVLDGGRIAGGAVAGAGAKGRISTMNGGRIDGADLTGLFGSKLAIASSGTDAKTRLAIGAGSSVPVGADSPFGPEVLRDLDLTGAKLVSKGGAVWPTEPTDLTGLRLTHGALPANADLSKVTLDRASLERVSFATATLTKDGRSVSLRDARLARSDFAHRAIDGVDFTNADLRGANLYDVTGHAIFDQAKAGILAAHVDDNDTDRAIVTTFATAQLSTSSFKGASLQYADFGDAGVAQAIFTHAGLEWARFDRAKLVEGGVANPTLKDATVLATSWENADLRGADLTGLDFGPSNGVRSSFEGAFLCGAKLTRTILHDANLRGAFFDVVGQVKLPDDSWIACTPGDRTGVDTRSTDPLLGTLCPNAGRAPMGADQQCSADQWKVQGGSPDQDRCTKEEASRTSDGGACTKDCQCQSAMCGASHTCEEP